MGELIAPAIDIGMSLFSGAGDAIGAAAPAVAEGAGDFIGAAAPAAAEGLGDASYFLPQAGEILGPAGTAITVGGNAAGEFGLGGAGLVGGLGGDFFGLGAGGFGDALASGAAGLGTGLGNFFSNFNPISSAGAAELPGVEPPAGETLSTGSGSMFSGLPGWSPGETLMSDNALGLTTAEPSGQGVQGGGNNPNSDVATDELAKSKTVPRPLDKTPIDQTPQGAQQAGQSVQTPQNINPAQPAQPAQAGQPAQAASAAAKPASTGGFFDSAAKWAGPAVGAAGLGYAIMNNNKNQVPSVSDTTAKQSALASQQAATGQQITSQGQDLASYISKGTLPPAFQTALDQATASAKARAVSNAAANGLPTDPTKNTALATTLQAIDQNAVVQSADIMQKLLASGTSLIQSGQQMAGLQQTIYDSLVKTDQQQTANTGKAIANFASALGGKPSSQPLLQIGGTTAA